jgi:hypothetical protein
MSLAQVWIFLPKLVLQFFWISNNNTHQKFNNIFHILSFKITKSTLLNQTWWGLSNNPIYKFTTSVRLSVCDGGFGGWGKEGGGEATGDLSATGNRFHFLINCCISLWTQFVCVSRERERERACARSFSSWTTFFPVAKEQEMVEEAVDDARSVC